MYSHSQIKSKEYNNGAMTIHDIFPSKNKIPSECRLMLFTSGTTITILCNLKVTKEHLLWQKELGNKESHKRRRGAGLYNVNNKIICG
jgi:hypothetical protein